MLFRSVSMPHRGPGVLLITVYSLPQIYFKQSHKIRQSHFYTSSKSAGYGTHAFPRLAGRRTCLFPQKSKRTKNPAYQSEKPIKQPSKRQRYVLYKIRAHQLFIGKNPCQSTDYSKPPQRTVTLMIHQQKYFCTTVNPECQILQGYKKSLVRNHPAENSQQIIDKCNKNAHQKGMQEKFFFTCHRTYRNSLLSRDSPLWPAPATSE